MNRVIKFRGERVDNGEWVYGAYFCLHHNDERTHIHHFIIPDDLPIPKNKPIGEIQVEVIPETVGQFTGLLDKNGKEIYEGDIVEWCYKMLIEFGEIICEGIGFKWSPINHDRVESITGFINEYEIIGNIHDNKDLLK